MKPKGVNRSEELVPGSLTKNGRDQGQRAAERGRGGEDHIPGARVTGSNRRKDIFSETGGKGKRINTEAEKDL